VPPGAVRTPPPPPPPPALPLLYASAQDHAGLETLTSLIYMSRIWRYLYSTYSLTHGTAACRGTGMWRFRACRYGACLLRPAARRLSVVCRMLPRRTVGTARSVYDLRRKPPPRSSCVSARAQHGLEFIINAFQTLSAPKLRSLDPDTFPHRPLHKHTRSSATAEIARVGGHYAVQGHSRSLSLVPIECSHATSY